MCYVFIREHIFLFMRGQCAYGAVGILVTAVAEIAASKPWTLGWPSEPVWQGFGGLGRWPRGVGPLMRHARAQGLTEAEEDQAYTA
jgi:hypothetical protein